MRLGFPEIHGPVVPRIGSPRLGIDTTVAGHKIDSHSRGVIESASPQGSKEGSSRATRRKRKDVAW